MSNIGYKENKPAEYAGYGVEFVWAVQTLQSLMAFNIILAIVLLL